MTEITPENVHQFTIMTRCCGTGMPSDFAYQVFTENGWPIEPSMTCICGLLTRSNPYTEVK